MTHASASVQISLQQLNSLAAIPAPVLDDVASVGKTLLLERCILEKDTTMPSAEGGWKFQMVWQPTPGEEPLGMGKIMLVHNDERTKKIWLTGQRHLALAAGLTSDQAYIWARSRTKRKHSVLNHLGRVMKDTNLIEAYMRFEPGVSHEEYLAWAKKYNITDKLHPEQRKLISQLVDEMVNAAQRARPERVVNPVLSNALQEAMQKHAAKEADAEPEPVAATTVCEDEEQEAVVVAASDETEVAPAGDLEDTTDEVAVAETAEVVEANQQQ